MVHPTAAKMSEQVNRKSPPRNVTVQLSTPYTDPEPANFPRKLSTQYDRLSQQQLGFLLVTKRQCCAVLEEAFRLFDKDGDGNITSSELQSVMNSLGQPVDIRQASEMIMSVDKDGKHHNILTG